MRLEAGSLASLGAEIPRRLDRSLQCEFSYNTNRVERNPWAFPARVPGFRESGRTYFWLVGLQVQVLDVMFC